MTGNMEEKVFSAAQSYSNQKFAYLLIFYHQKDNLRKE